MIFLKDMKKRQQELKQIANKVDSIKAKEPQGSLTLEYMKKRQQELKSQANNNIPQIAIQPTETAQTNNVNQDAFQKLANSTKRYSMQTSSSNPYLDAIQKMGNQYYDELWEIQSGFKTKSDYTKKEYAKKDNVSTLTAEQYYKDLIDAKANQGFGDYLKEGLTNIGNNISSAVLGIGEGAGGQTVAKIADKTIGNTILKANGFTDKEIKEFQNIMGIQSGESLDQLYEQLGNKDFARNAGNIAGYMLAGITATSLGIASPAVYAALNAFNTYGRTDDLGDIAASAGTGALFGAISDKVGGFLGKTLGKIPSTNTNLVANILKNFTSKTGGIYAANALTKEARNVYDKFLRDRNVTKEDWLKPLWSDETLKTTVIGGLIATGFATANDMSKAKVQLRNDYNVLTNQLNENARNMVEALRNGNVPAAQQYNAESLALINTFTKMQYLGMKVNPNANTLLTDRWNAIAYAATTQYNPTRIAEPIPQLPNANVSNNLPSTNTISNATQYTVPNTTPDISSIAKQPINDLPDNSLKENSISNITSETNDGELFDAILNQLDPKEIRAEELKLLTEKYGDEIIDMDWSDYAYEVEQNATENVYYRYVNSEDGKNFIKNFNTKNGISENSKADIIKHAQYIIDELDNNDNYISETDIENAISENFWKLSEETRNELAKLEDNEDIDIAEEIYKLQKDTVKDQLTKLGYEYDKDSKGYNKNNQLIDAHDAITKWLDDNNIDYEVSKSTNPGLFPSIYIKDIEGNVIKTIANHQNIETANTIRETYTNADLLDTDKIIDDIKNSIKNKSNIKLSKYAIDNIRENKYPKVNGGEKNGGQSRNQKNNVPRKIELSQLVERERRGSALALQNLLLTKKNLRKSLEKPWNNANKYYFTGSESSFIASNGDIYLNEEQIKDYGEEQIIKHEKVENMIINHLEAILKDFEPMIEEIYNNTKAINELFKWYTSNMPTNDKLDVVKQIPKFAKEIFCDIYASTANHPTAIELKKNLIKSLGNEFYKNTLNVIEQKIKEIYSDKNSNKSSSFLPKKSYDSDIRADKTSKTKNVVKQETTRPSLYDELQQEKKAIVAGEREKKILLSQGLTEEEIKDPANGYVQGILQKLKTDSEYYDRMLSEIEQTNNVETKRTNYLLNKRRWDTLKNGNENSKYAKKSSLSSMRKEIEKDISKPVRLKGYRNSAYGIYKINEDEIRVKDLSNIETITHELGHKIDFKMLQRAANENMQMSKELDKLAERAFGDMYDDEPMVKEEEGFAEFVRRFIVSNEVTQKEYPALSDYFKEQISEIPKIKELVTNVIELVENYVNAPSNVSMESILSVGEATDKPASVGEWFTDGFNNFMYQTFDDAWYVQKLTRAYAKTQGKHITQLSTIENVYDKTRLYKANETSLKNIIQHGFYDENGSKITKGLTEILEPLVESKEKMSELRQLLLARRGLDYMARNLEVGVMSPDILNTLERIQDPQIIKAVNEIEEFAEQPMKMAQKSGMITKEEYEELKKYNKFYVPLKRVFDGEKVSTGIGRKGASKLYKGRTGSLRDIVDPIESIVQNTEALIEKINQNDIMLTLSNYASKGNMSDFYSIVPIPQQLKATVSAELFKDALEDQLVDLGVDAENIDFEIIKNIFAPKLSDDKTMTLTFMENGEMKAIQFYDKHLYEFFANAKGIAKKTVDFLKMFDKATNLLRKGATQMNLEFTAANIIKDTVTAAFYSDSGFKVGYDSVKGMVDFAIAEYGLAPNSNYSKENAKLYDYYQQSGAPMSTRVASYREGVQDMLKETIGKYIVDANMEDEKSIKETMGKIWEAITNAIDKGFELVEILPELSEQGTRFAYFKLNYNKLIKQGYTHKQAMLEAGINTKDITLDFNRAGNTMRVINRLKAFSNAQVQGVYRAILGVEKGFHDKKYGRALLLKLAIIAGITAAIKASTSGDKEIEEIPDTVKNDNWILKVGGKIIKIPITEDFLMKNTINLTNSIQEVIDSYKPVDEIRATFLENFANSLSPINWDRKKDIFENIAGNITPTSITPEVEAALDRDFYYGSQITPYGTEDLSPEYQYDYKTSKTAIMLGKFFKTSPAKLDHIFTGYGAGVSQQIIRVLDNTIDFFSEDITLPETADTDKLFVRRFTIDPNKNSQSVSDVYDMYDELNTKKKDGLISGDSLTETEEKIFEDLSQAKSTFSLINKEVKDVTNSMTLNAKEKRQQIDDLKSLRTDVARYYLGKELINKDNESKIQLYEFYPSSDKYKIAGEQVTLTWEDKKKYAELANENYNERMKEVSKEYSKASESEKAEIRKYQKTQAKNNALNQLKEIIYKRNNK